jgi:hypothetical protein
MLVLVVASLSIDLSFVRRWDEHSVTGLPQIFGAPEGHRVNGNGLGTSRMTRAYHTIGGLRRRRNAKSDRIHTAIKSIQVDLYHRMDRQNIPCKTRDSKLNENYQKKRPFPPTCRGREADRRDLRRRRAIPWPTRPCCVAAHSDAAASRASTEAVDDRLLLLLATTRAAPQCSLE